MRDTIHNEVHKVIDKAIDLRHRFHEIPESSFKENKTSHLIVQELQQMGLVVEEGIAGTGVAANIKGELPGNTIALRALCIQTQRTFTQLRTRWAYCLFIRSSPYTCET